MCNALSYEIHRISDRWLQKSIRYCSIWPLKIKVKTLNHLCLWAAIIFNLFTTRLLRCLRRCSHLLLYVFVSEDLNVSLRCLSPPFPSNSAKLYSYCRWEKKRMVNFQRDKSPAPWTKMWPCEWNHQKKPVLKRYGDPWSGREVFLKVV